MQMGKKFSQAIAKTLYELMTSVNRQKTSAFVLKGVGNCVNTSILASVAFLEQSCDT
jgi:uncharacterized membrane protein